MLGYGWLSFIDPGDRVRVGKHWRKCIDRNLAYFDRYTIERPSGEKIRCRTRAYKIQNGPVAVFFIGVVELDEQLE